MVPRGEDVRAVLPDGSATWDSLDAWLAVNLIPKTVHEMNCESYFLSIIQITSLFSKLVVLFLEFSKNLHSLCNGGTRSVVERVRNSGVTPWGLVKALLEHLDQADGRKRATTAVMFDQEKYLIPRRWRMKSHFTEQRKTTAFRAFDRWLGIAVTSPYCADSVDHGIDTHTNFRFTFSCPTCQRIWARVFPCP